MRCIAATAASTVITDGAGNTLALTIARALEFPRVSTLVMPSFTYSSGTTTATTTSLRYFHLTNPNTGAYSLFISHIKTPTERFLAVYVKFLNKTYVLESKPQDDDADLSAQQALLLLRKKVKTYTGLYIKQTHGAARELLEIIPMTQNAAETKVVQLLSQAGVRYDRAGDGVDDDMIVIPVLARLAELEPERVAGFGPGTCSAGDHNGLLVFSTRSRLSSRTDDWQRPPLTRVAVSFCTIGALAVGLNAWNLQVGLHRARLPSARKKCSHFGRKTIFLINQ